MFRYFLLLFISFVSFAQQTDKVDFITCNALLTPNQYDKSISGEIIYEFVVSKKMDTIKIDAINMQFSEVKINNKIVDYKNSGKTLDLFEGFQKGKNSLTFSYKATPKQALYFNGENENLQIWTQGQGKYTSNWLPSFDDVNEKVIFNISVISKKNTTVISNGIEKTFPTNGNQIAFDGFGTEKLIHFQMHKPMSSYLVMLAIGDFAKQTSKSKLGTTLEFYLDKKDSLKFEPTYRYSKQLFDFLEEEIGVKYPWEIYKQVPVRDFLYAGMENTTATIFSQDFVVDEIGFNDRNYLNVNAHELAHQWFGNLITAKESKHHWLQEGFATYYALLAEKELFGEDYFYHQLYLNALELNENAKQDTIPILNEKASSLTFYKKGAWALHVLRTNIGEKKFKKAVKSYLKKYAFKNVNTDDFLNEIKKVSNFNVDNFKKEWLESSDFKWNEVLSILNENTFITQIEKIKTLDNSSFFKNKDMFLQIMYSDAYYPVKQELLYLMKELLFNEKKELIIAALNSNDIKVRQALIETTNVIPLEYVRFFEEFLNDKSYITRELALYSLYTKIYYNRDKYVELSKDWEGLNYNLKLAHLTLKYAQNAEKKLSNDGVIKEFINYSKEPFEIQTRQNALELLLQLEKISDDVLLSLIDFSLHHKWQAVKFAKDSIRELIKTSSIKNQFQDLKNKATNIQIKRIDYFLNE